MLGKIDVVVGRLVREASRLGFLATTARWAKRHPDFWQSAKLKDATISPEQSKSALEALQHLRSTEGKKIREERLHRAELVRDIFARHEVECPGVPSDTVIIPVSDLDSARATVKNCAAYGISLEVIDDLVGPDSLPRLRWRLCADLRSEELVRQCDIVLEYLDSARAQRTRLWNRN
jgi:7-keto-8-aminopelargonate synthetase-like enzyme